MFCCSDCFNDTLFKEVEGSVVCTSCGLVLQHHVFDGYHPDCHPIKENDKRYEMEFIELFSKFDLHESLIENVIELFENFKAKCPMRGDKFASMKLACISVVTNVKVYDNLKIYYKVKEFHRNGLIPSSRVQQKEYLSDMLLLNELISSNTKYDSCIRKTVHIMLDKLPNTSKELSRVKERNIFLGIIFLSIKNKIDIKDFCKHNNVSTVTILKLKKLICELLS